MTTTCVQLLYWYLGLLIGQPWYILHVFVVLCRTLLKNLCCRFLLKLAERSGWDEGVVLMWRSDEIDDLHLLPNRGPCSTMMARRKPSVHTFCALRCLCISFNTFLKECNLKAKVWNFMWVGRLFCTSYKETEIICGNVFTHMAWKGIHRFVTNLAYPCLETRRRFQKG